MDQHDIEQEFGRKLAEEREKLGGCRPNVLVCGQTGSGKTSLIQAICGEDLVPADAIGDAAPTTGGFDEYADEHIRIWDSKGFEPGEEDDGFILDMRSFLRERLDGTSPEEHVHLVWHAIQACGARVTDCDLKLLREVFRPEHTIVVLTKADIARPGQIEAMTSRLVEAGVDRDRILPASDRRSGSLGCRELMELSYRLLPAACRESFLEAQRIDRESRLGMVRQRRGRAAAIISAATATAAGIGAVPIPIADAALLIPLQTGMIASLAALHGIGREAIGHAVLPFVARVAGIYASSSLLKLFPVLGSAVNAAMAASLTGAMGWFVQSRFEGMAIARIEGEPVPDLDFDLGSFRDYYRAYRTGEE